MAIQYASLTYSYVVDNYVDLPTGAPPGQLAYVVNTAKAYYSTNGTWKEVGLGVTGGYQPYKYSFDNPPASPSAYDDEFDSTALSGNWTVVSTGTTNPAVSGTVNPTASLTTPIYDLSTIPSYLLFQSDNSSVATVSFRKTVSLGTDATFFYKCAFDNRLVNTSGEAQVTFSLSNSGDSNENARMYMQSIGTGYRYRLTINNNGVVTESIGSTLADGNPVTEYYVVLWKSGNNYYGGVACGSAPMTVIGPLAKTGVTTFDRIDLDFFTANETPSMIAGIDFFRYYPSITYALMN